MQTIHGIVRNIIFHNEENHYHILSAEIDDEEVVLTGYFNQIAIEVPYTFEVIQKDHPTYGKQYQVQSFQMTKPETELQIIQFLGSGLFDGIGPAIAERIVTHFGQDALDVMRYNPERLKEIQGIGAATFEKINASFVAHIEAEEVLFFLNKLGLSVKQAMKIYEAYGQDAIVKIKKNPYYLVKDIRGLGFKQVDQIAMQLGFSHASIERVMSILVYLLEQEAQNGHMFLSQDDLLRKAEPMVNEGMVLLDQAMTQLVMTGEIYIDRMQREERVYTKRLHQVESGIVREIVRLFSGMTKDLSYKKNFSQLELTEEQQMAVDRAFDEAMFVLTGGPGTGKTTILKELVLRLEASETDYCLAAPTGRAANRMEEVIGRQASTIHRLLEYQFQEDTEFLHFHRNADNPIEAEVVVIDEASMLDAPLFLKLLEAIKTGSRLLLIGDVNQLPAVGPGNVLSDLIESNAIPTHRIFQIHRQAADSLILINAHAILKDEEVYVNQKGRDFFLIQRQGMQAIQSALLDVVCHRLPTYYGLKPIEQITVLTPVRGGILGADQLNIALQTRLNPSKEDKIFGRFLQGDKVMQNRNNYQLEWIKDQTVEVGNGVFNGEIGWVDHVGKKGMKVTFSDGKSVQYTKETSDDLVLAYAMTIHKSQGNEFDYVVMPVFAMPEPLRSKNLIYTAITRAKKQVTLVGDGQFFSELIHKDEPIIRMSGLADRLRKVNDDPLKMDVD